MAQRRKVTISLELPGDLKTSDPEYTRLVNERLRRIGAEIEEVKGELGTFAISGDLDMQGHRITHLGDAKDSGDAISRGYGDRRYLIRQQGTSTPTTVAATGSSAQKDKATFGVISSLAVANDITNHYICRLPGKFNSCAVNLKTAATGAAVRLDVKKSTDEGQSWATIFTGGSITIPAADTTLNTFNTFPSGNDSIAANDFLRLDCLQIGSAIAGAGLELVLIWTPE